MDLGQRPKTLFCYICGRQFGTSSLQIHLKNCIKKFELQQSKKQTKNKIKCPEPPEELATILSGNFDMEIMNIYNEKAIHTHKYKALPSCRFCGRTFNEESLKAHENGCNKKGNKIEQKASYNIPQTYKKPRTLVCCVCGRQFGLTSLKIHYPQCIQKFKNEQKKKPKEERKTVPEFSQEQLQLINNKGEWTIEEIEQFNNGANGNYRDKAMVQCDNCKRKFIYESYLKHKKNCVMINGKKEGEKQKKSTYDQLRETGEEFRKPRVLMCHICGRQFGLSSLSIHQKQCEVKFLNNEKKKPKTERKPLPEFPETDEYNLQEAENWSKEKIAEYNRIANDVYREESLVACPVCGRKFFQESLPKHLKYCEKNAKKSIQNNSQSQSKMKKIKSNNTDLTQSITFGQKSKDKRKELNTPQKSSPMKQSFLKQSLYKKIDSSRKKEVKEENNDQMKEVPEWLEQTNKKQEEQENQFFEKQSQEKQEENKEEQVSKFEEQAKKSVRNVLSPSEKVRSSQGFAAPRKKQQELMNSMKECSICQRKFSDDKIEKHEKICRQAEMKEKKRKQQKLKQEIPEIEFKKKQSDEAVRQVISPEQKARSSKGFAAPRMKEETIEASMAKCIGCERKFTSDRIEKHQSVCKKAKQKIELDKKAGQKLYASEEVEQKKSIKRAQCPKCKRKFAEDRIEKHQEICKGTKGQLNIPKPMKKQYNLDFENGASQNQEKIEFQECEKCGRKFNSQRISKHIEVCKGKNQTQDKISSSKNLKNSNKNTDLIECEECHKKFPSDNIHKHFQLCKRKINQNAPQDKKPAEKALETIGQDQYVEENLMKCPKCERKFKQQRLEKHMDACKGTNKIKQKNLVSKHEEEVRKTKKEFFTMVKDLKEKKVNDHEIDKQLEEELRQIQKTHQISRKENKCQNKQVPHKNDKSTVLPKI